MNSAKEKKKGTKLFHPASTRETARACSIALIALASLFLASACGGGGSGGGGQTASASALELPGHIDITEVGGNTSPGLFNSPSGFDDPGTDYTDQEKQSWVDDDFEALDTVNDILGIMKNSGYEYFVNQGPYKALVNQVGQSGESQGGSSSTNSQTEQLMEIILDVSRADNRSPMFVKIWCFEDDGPSGAPILIRGYFRVDEGVSEEYPCGVMEAHIKANLLDSSGKPVPGDPIFTNALSITAENGNVIVQFIDAGQDDSGPFAFEWDHEARIVAESGLASGHAYVYDAQTDPDTQQLEEETYYIAFNEDYFRYLQDGAADPVALDKNSLGHRIYRYLLFDKDTGARVDRNSGIPIRLEDGKYAYVGYYGLWAPEGAEIEDGDTVTGAEDGEQYTLVNVRGKLTKHTRKQVLLGDLTDVEIYVWDEAEQVDDIVVWDGVDSFQKIAVWDHELDQITYLDPPEPYTFENEWDGGWCDPLSAWLCLGGLTPANGDIVYYHEEETVNPSATGDLYLYYWGFALDAPITQSVIDNAPAAQQNYWSGPPTEKTYFYDSQNIVLKEDDVLGAEVILGEDLELEGTEYEDGYWMMPMTTDGSYTENNCWEIYDDEIYYSWATGPNEWNQYATLRNAGGTLLTFDAPLKFSYTHLTDNDINGDSTNDGKKFNLDYDGYDLHIPWNYDEEADDWVPAFNLKDGVELTSGGNEYVVKGVEEGLIMEEVTDPQILAQLETDLPIITTIQAPDLTYKSSWTDKVGAVPQNAELKVIKGELIEE